MPFIDVQSQSTLSSFLVAAHVSTVTVYNQPTVSASPIPQQTQTVPVGAIAGGAVGGVCLAVVMVVAWTTWGRSIERTKAKQQMEAVRDEYIQIINKLTRRQDAHRITRKNTAHNAHALSKPRTHSYRPIFWSPPPPGKVKFANEKPLNDKDTLVANDKRDAPATVIPSHPKPLRSAKSEGSRDAAQIDATDLNRPRTQPRVSSPLVPPPPLLHKQSNVSSGSEYSVETGEAHQTRTPRHLLAALGNLGSSSGAQGSEVPRNSKYSATSNWTFLSRSSNGQKGTQSNRVSQATSASLYSQPDDPTAVPVGVAY